MIPTACMVLLIPAFFVTVFIEKKVDRGTLGETAGRMSVPRATWSMHLITYGLLLAVGLCLLGSSLAAHKSEPVASPNGGAAGRSGDFGVSGAPPSVR
jgi:hypothetical protein